MMRGRIIFEDDDILVVYKPAKIAVQSASIMAIDLESELKTYLAKESENSLFLGVVHRLDQPVEGLLIFGKNAKATAKLSKQLQENQLVKTYLAVVHGKVNEGSWQRSDYLMKDGQTKMAKISSIAKEGYKKAILAYQCIDYDQEQNFSLVEISIETGRFHQIRAQMAYAGYPLVGDRKYGVEELGEWKDVSVALCANRIQGKHPRVKKDFFYEIKPENRVFKLFKNF